LKRGDIITVAISGDYGKPRPALIIQSDLLSDTDSVLVCLITSELRDAPVQRLDLPADATTGLQAHSQAMAEKIIAVRRDKVGKQIGHVDRPTMLALGQLLTFVIGVAD